jgi:hypothetical protein
MNLREPTLLEGPLDLARFFITSLTFMRAMRKVDMLVDNVKVLEVEKSVRGRQRVGKRGMKDTSSAGMMKVTGVDKTEMVITAKVMEWLSSKSRSLIVLTGSNRFCTPATTTAGADVQQAHESARFHLLLGVLLSIIRLPSPG